MNQQPKSLLSSITDFKLLNPLIPPTHTERHRRKQRIFTTSNPVERRVELRLEILIHLAAKKRNDPGVR